MSQIFTLTHKELAAVLVKHYDLHEGHWGLYVEFGLQAGNVGPTDADLFPAAITLVNRAGLQRFDGANGLTVDAAIVNPSK